MDFQTASTPWLLWITLQWRFSSVQSLSRVRLFATPWTAACQASLSITNSKSLLKLMSIESLMPSNHLILCHLLFLLPSIFPSIRVFSNESVLHITWPKYWSFSFSISPSNEFQDWFPLGWTGWISLQSKGLSRVFSNTTVQKHQFFSAWLSLWSNSCMTTGKTIALTMWVMVEGKHPWALIPPCESRVRKYKLVAHNLNSAFRNSVFCKARHCKLFTHYRQDA